MTAIRHDPLTVRGAAGCTAPTQAKEHDVKVLLFEASGNIGRAIAQELLSREHTVAAVTRRGTVDGIDHGRFTTTAGEATDPVTVASWPPDTTPGRNVTRSGVRCAGRQLPAPAGTAEPDKETAS